MEKKDVEKKQTMKKMIFDYLKINGLSKAKDICNFIKEKRSTATVNSVTVTLWSDDSFINKGYGMWCIDNNPNESREKIICKLSILVEHYQASLKEKGFNNDSRYGGIDFDESEKELIETFKKKYRKK
jgi:hypothetical protein